MHERHKKILRAVVGELRHTLAGAYDDGDHRLPGDLERELERLGFGPDGSIAPLDALPHATAAERRAYRVAETQLAPLAKAARLAARAELVERAAYSWINRLLALRAMEARGLTDETLRLNPDYEGVSEALYILRQMEPARAAGADAGWSAVLDDACARFADVLPGLFDPADPNTALRPGTAALIRCITAVGGAPAGFTLDEADAAFADPDAIGWAYQFYQEEAKARMYAKLGSGGKAGTRAEIAAKTQLFTEPYMVKWLLQNSLGRTYHELYPDSALPDTWEYYVRPDSSQPPAQSPLSGFASLTVMDPCMGSGHFLREAFDMLAAMYREGRPTLPAADIAARILADHLYGIDIDPRAAQLAALTLYLRAWEWAKAERRRERAAGGSIALAASDSAPPSAVPTNLAATPTGLTSGALERHLERHPEDRVFKPLLEGVFAALEQADILGSLLRPAEHLDAAMAALQKPRTLPLAMSAGDDELQRTIVELGKRDPAQLKRQLLERIGRSFALEARETDDVAACLFGREAAQGVRLLQLLDRQYAIVATNPPYIGSKNMDTALKRYVEQHYTAGKRDLYAAFILRCLELCISFGRIAMVTQHGWMLQDSFSELRARSRDKSPAERGLEEFEGLLYATTIESLAHLGEFAFEDKDAAGAFVVMFALNNHAPKSEHRFTAMRLVGLKSPALKAAFLREVTSTFSANGKGQPVFYPNVNYPQQSSFLDVADSLLVYALPDELLALLTGSHKLSSIANVRQGLATADNNRFTRCFWETMPGTRWVSYAKGGGYSKWAGLEWLVLDWQFDGGRVRAFDRGRFQAIEFYFAPGLTYTPISRGGLGVRLLHNSAFDVKGSSIFPKYPDVSREALAVHLNTHTASFLTRAISQSLELHVGYLSQLPMPRHWVASAEGFARCVFPLKADLVSADPAERAFQYVPSSTVEPAQISALLHSAEAVIESEVCKVYGLSDQSVSLILEETGPPAGWYPLVAGYDALPPLPDNLDLPPLPQEVLDYLAAHERKRLAPDELARLKANLRALYEAGPNARDVELDEGDVGDVDDEAVAGAHIPIPTETFLEELSVKLGVHPISVYWLLEELRAAGARCKPEEQRLLEDRLTVLVLRLLGHRWPRQVEAGEAVPAWADADGIIPLMPGASEATLAERVRARLQAEDGDVGAQRVENLLHELTGLSLDEWTRRRFWPRHVQQFKYRPVAWHLASRPQGGGRRGARRTPAFECLLYYHKCSADALARIRTQYVEPLLQAERQNAAAAGRDNRDADAALALARLQELEEFAARLRGAQDEGFACAELDALVAQAPLDRWDGDGYTAPVSREALLQAERAWRVDLNDGVRVNIAPLQLAGLLASDVLRAPDARKAVADRARWRTDERRWVREGKLPRPGWVDEGAPESTRWRELAPQREAERVRLEQRRQAALQRTAESD